MMHSRKNKIHKNPKENSWIQISASALHSNVEFFRKRISNTTRLCCVVKANAYGHGLREVVSCLKENASIDSWAVISLDEGLVVRNIDPRRPILVLGSVPLGRLGELAKHDLENCVFNEDQIIEMSRINGYFKIHIKVDTGMGRLGVLPHELKHFIEFIKQFGNIEIVGVMSHFANTEDVLVQGYANEQIRKFEFARTDIHTSIVGRNVLFHMSSTAGTLLFPHAHYDMVRIGIGLYGIWPSHETRLSLFLKGGFIHEGEQNKGLRPALQWFASVVSVKFLTKGSFVGYGCSYRVRRDSRIAVLPIGYFEGYSRALSNQSVVKIGGQLCPIVGRVCMNMCMVDITDAGEITVGDVVTLIGGADEEEITLDDAAKWSQTIPYEFVTRINCAIPRFVV